MLRRQLLEEPPAGGPQRLKTALEVRSNYVFEPAPEVFHWVVLRGAPWQVHHLQPVVAIDQLLNGLRQVPTGIVPDEQNPPLDAAEHPAKESLGVVGSALRIRLYDHLTTCDIERTVETKLAVLLGYGHRTLLADGHPGAPQRRETSKLGLVFEQNGGLRGGLGNGLVNVGNAFGVIWVVGQAAPRTLPTKLKAPERLAYRLRMHIDVKRSLQVLGQARRRPAREVVAGFGGRRLQEALELGLGLLVELGRAPFTQEFLRLLAVVKAFRSLFIEALDPLVDGRVADLVNLGDLVGGAAARREQDHVSAHRHASYRLFGHGFELVAFLLAWRAHGAVAHGVLGGQMLYDRFITATNTAC